MREGLLSHVNDTAAQGKKKAELMNRSGKVFMRAILGRDGGKEEEKLVAILIETFLDLCADCSEVLHRDLLLTQPRAHAGSSQYLHGNGTRYEAARKRYKKRSCDEEVVPVLLLSYFITLVGMRL